MKAYSNLTYSEKERICENIFLNEGPFWHLYTDGTKMHDIFTSNDEFDTGMNLLGILKFRHHNIKIVAFELMHNHLHMIMTGKKEMCLEYFEDYKLRLSRIFKRNGRILDWSLFKASIIQIENLKALRNEIIYAHRNAFVAHPEYTPYNYPWGSGCSYFNSTLQDLPTVDFDSLTIDRRRELAHMRDISGLGKLKMCGDRVYIPSFCIIDIGESLFTDPRSYFSSLTRNSESYSEIASRLKDSVFLIDDEIFSVAVNYCMEEFSIRQLNLLSPEQRIQVAKHLHFKYNATKQQLRRLLKLDSAVLEQLFPNIFP